MQQEAEELKLFIDNDYDIYRQRPQTIIKSLIRKKKRGIYNSTGAAQAFTYVVVDGAKKYAKENAGIGEWNKIFPPKLRLELAREYAKEFEEDYNNGEFQ
jgi:hypothetical protein